MKLIFARKIQKINNPVDVGLKLNVHQTFRRRPGRLLNVLCKFSLLPVSTGLVEAINRHKKFFLTCSAQQNCLHQVGIYLLKVTNGNTREHVIAGWAVTISYHKKLERIIIVSSFCR